MPVEKKSTHILAVSANLFGLCFVVFSFLKANKASDYTYLDEFTTAPMLFFMISSFTSFLSIRDEENVKRSKLYEKIADYSFLGGMMTLFVAVILIVFKAFA